MSYKVIYADPPWRYDNGTPGREVENHYPTMTDEELCAMKPDTGSNCVLYMWATAPRLESALRLIREWGFNYKTNAVWDKEIMGIGYWFRGQHELLLVATKGAFSPPTPEQRISSVIRCKRGAHSSKPDLIRDKLTAWFPGPRLEMFSRIKRPGWEAFGNQVEEDLLSNA